MPPSTPNKENFIRHNGEGIIVGPQVKIRTTVLKRRCGR